MAINNYNKNIVNTVFHDNLEGFRFNYNGNVFIGLDENSFRVVFENLEETDLSR